MTKPRVIRSISAADFASIADEFANKDGMIFEIHALRAERDALRVFIDGLKEIIGLLRGSAVAGWCAECKGSGYITTHLGSEGSGTVATRKCVCGGNPFLRNATAEFWLEER